MEANEFDTRLAWRRSPSSTPLWFARVQLTALAKLIASGTLGRGAASCAPWSKVVPVTSGIALRTSAIRRKPAPCPAS
jgi:hypothetical protein